MFIVEGRTLGVVAALGVVLSMVVVFDRLSEVADSTESPSLAASATASAAPYRSVPGDGGAPVRDRSGSARGVRATPQRGLCRHASGLGCFGRVLQSDVPGNRADPHTAGVSDASIRGHTDQFRLKFIKPM